MATKFDNESYIDIRDVTDRVDELRSERDEFTIPHPDGGEVEAPEEWAGLNPEDAEELADLEALLSELEGNGGDHEWEGAWYPGQMIADYEFVSYVQDLVSDIGDMPRDIPSYIEIDWEATARNVRMDYCSVDFDGREYWFR